MLIESARPHLRSQHPFAQSVWANCSAAKAPFLLYDPTRKQYQIARNKGRTGLNDGQYLSLNLSEQLRSKSIIHCDKRQRRQPSGTIFRQYDVRYVQHANQYQTHRLSVHGRESQQTTLCGARTNFIWKIWSISQRLPSPTPQLVSELRSTNLQLDRRVQEMHTLFDLSKEFNAQC